MPIIFANPWGLLGLLAVPALLAIHFLQRRTKMIPVTTLFLIEQRRDQARMGRRFDRLISSVPLWLQLLMALLLAAHLAQPRLPAAGSVLRLAVVVDDSASMRVFKPDLLRELAALAEKHRGQARRIEWLVMPANPSRPRLYAGTETSAMLATLDGWQAVEGVADPRPALHLARERVGLHGMVVYATDTPCEALPADAVLLAVGRPIDNTGCTGVTVGLRDGVASWQALVSNNGSSPVNRQWHLEWDGKGRTETATVAVPAGGTASVGGPLPAGAARLCLVLEPDTFALDDRFPFLAPVPKPLYFRSQLATAYQWLPERVERSVPGMGKAASDEIPDLVFAASADGLFPTVTGPAILMSSAADPAAMTLAEPVAAIRHPLVDGLVWESLSVLAVPMIPADPNDTVLVWAGPTPLISLRPLPPPADGANSGPATGQLILHFNPNQSNFDRLPAAAVLMLRYCEELRLAKRGTAREQLEPHQALAPLLPNDPRGDLVLESLDASGKVTASRTLPARERAAFAAPDEPGFMRLREGGITLIEGAIAFADAREGDFRACATRLPEAAVTPASQAADALAPWWPLVLLLILILLLLSWAYTGREILNSKF